MSSQPIILNLIALVMLDEDVTNEAVIEFVTILHFDAASWRDKSQPYTGFNSSPHWLCPAATFFVLQSSRVEITSRGHDQLLHGPRGQGSGCPLDTIIEIATGQWVGPEPSMHSHVFLSLSVSLSLFPL
jgi:hypothetical protein